MAQREAAIMLLGLGRTACQKMLHKVGYGNSLGCITVTCNPPAFDVLCHGQFVFRIRKAFAKRLWLPGWRLPTRISRTVTLFTLSTSL
jgi:hypothetical protein